MKIPKPLDVVSYLALKEKMDFLTRGEKLRTW